MQDFLFLVGNQLIYVYSLILLASLYKAKELNSLSLAAMVVLIIELISLPLRNPLLEYVSQIAEPYRFILWYGTWSFINLLTASLIFFLHIQLSVNTGNAYRIVVGFSITFTIFQLVGYVDSAFINSPIIDIVYRFGILSLNLLLALLLIIELVRPQSNVTPNIYSNDL